MQVLQLHSNGTIELNKRKYLDKMSWGHYDNRDGAEIVVLSSYKATRKHKNGGTNFDFSAIMERNSKNSKRVNGERQGHNSKVVNTVTRRK